MSALLFQSIYSYFTPAVNASEIHILYGGDGQGRGDNKEEGGGAPKKQEEGGATKKKEGATNKDERGRLTRRRGATDKEERGD